MDTRQWRNYVELEMIELLRELEYELKFTKHAVHCEECLLVLCLDVERYWGTHTGLWFLNMQNEDEYFMEVYPTAPDPRKYKFGSYWTKDEGQAIPFIKDRLQWAKSIIKKQLITADQLLMLVQNWDSSDKAHEQFANLCTQLGIFVATPPSSDDYA